MKAVFFHLGSMLVLALSAWSQNSAEPDHGSFTIAKSSANAVLVFRREDGGQGTGFIVRREIAGKNRFFVYTNQHVIAGGKNLPKAFRPDGSAVPLGKLITAIQYDVAIFTLDSPEANFLELQPDVDKEINVGESLATPGNSGGASTITFKHGKVVAIGPELIEIDAPIKGGNSGGPIIHRNGRVIGIVSFFREETRDDDRITGAAKDIVIRRFGYRLDNIKSWETPDWPKFVTQGERFAKVEAHGRDLLQLVNTGFKQWNGNEQIGRIMRGFEKNIGSARSQKDAADDVSKALLQLKGLTLADIDHAANDTGLYWWWKSRFAEERKIREQLDKEFEKEAREQKQKG